MNALPETLDVKTEHGSDTDRVLLPEPFRFARSGHWKVSAR